MKRLVTLYLSIIVVCINTIAQTTQNGLTLSYNESNKKTPLGGVQIVIRDAGSTISNANGNFSLKFNTSKPGDKVTYREISKNGYEIFNIEALEQWNISSQNKPFVIILCKSSLFKKLKDKYNQVASASYAEQYKKEQQIVKRQLNDGKIKEEEYRRKILQLEDDYYKQLSNLNSYIDKFARIDLSELNDLEKTIIDYVQKGEIEKAISIYESQDYLLKYKQETKKIADISDAEQKLKKLSEEIASDRETLLKSIQNQVMVYKMAGGYNNMQKAKQLLVDVANADTTNSASSILLADFLYEQQNFEDAILYYQLGGRHTEDNEKLIKIYLKIGQIVSQSTTSKDSPLFDIALGILNYAGKLFNEMPEHKIIANIKLKLNYYYSVGRLYLNVKDYENAESYYSGIKRFYEEEESMYNLYEISNCSIVLAQVYQATKRLAQADSILNVCIPQIEKLFNEDKKGTVELYAESLRLKGGNFLLKGDDKSWLNYSQKEIEILEETDVDNSKGVIYILADVYNRVAAHYEITKDTLRATSYYKKAYQTLKRDTTFSFLANGTERFRLFQSIIFHLMDIKDYDYALSIIKDEQQLTNYFDVLDVYKAEIMYNINHIEDAILLFSDVIRNKKTVYTSDGYLHLNQQLKEHLSILYNDKRDYSDDETAILLQYYYGYKYLHEGLYEKAIPFLKGLVLFGEKINLKILQETLYNIGEIYINDNYKDKNYDIALDYTKKSYEKGFDQASNNIAWILYLKGEYAEALPYAEEVVKKYPNNANFLDTLAAILASLNRKKEAIDIYKKCIDILQKENRLEEAEKEQRIVDSIMK